MSKEQIVNVKNRQLSQNIWMTIDTRVTDLNNNIFVIGGSGAGKSFRFAKPNLMQMFGSYIATDPKGELMRDSAGFLKSHGYKIKVLNLLNAKEMRKSTRYNPFAYLKADIDVVTLINQMIANTTPKGSSASDPFWEKAEAMLWQALFYYVWKEGVLMPDGRVHHNFPAVMELLKKAEFKTDARGNKLDSELDMMMYELEEREPNHPAVINYNKCMRGAADTVRSIIISANARLAVMGNNDLLQLLSEDEMDLAGLGREKTALYCVIPDNDKSFNFIVGMLYSQMFKELYYQADFVYGGSLPVHVTCLFDEFANVALPDDFCSLLSTMRSRNISSIIIIQNLAQIKKLFKDDWESIPGNCDVLIYLGGNEQSTHKFMSEQLGKMTIDKRSNSETKGKQESTSFNNDVLGRELMTPDEVRKLPKKKCLILIRGYDPIIDDKIRTQFHPLWKEFCKTQKGYRFDARMERAERNGLFVRNTEIDALIRLDDINEKDNEYEISLAQKIGMEAPPKYHRQVVRLIPEDFFNIGFKNMSDEDLQLLDESVLESNRERARHEYQKQLEEKREMERNTIDINSLSKKEAMAYVMLSSRDFSQAQIKILLKLTTLDNWENLITLFLPDMDTKKEIEPLVNKLVS